MVTLSSVVGAVAPMNVVASATLYREQHSHRSSRQTGISLAVNMRTCHFFSSQNPCTIKYRASTSGWFAVALMLEDFTSSSSSVPLSKVPLQFLIQVAQRGTSCGAGVKFASSTLSDNICVTVPPGTTFTTKISVTEGTNTLVKQHMLPGCCFLTALILVPA